MSNVSSSLLYHYTSCKQNLFSILKYGFKPSYCREKVLTNPDASFDFAVPMTCFCDIPEKVAVNHRDNYGEYAIGLSDSWRIKNRLNPMLYLAEDSDMFNQIKKLGGIVVKMKNTYEDKTIKIHVGKPVAAAGVYEDPEEISILEKLFYSFLIRIKPYTGPKYDKKGDLTNYNYKYYDEREYRYIFEQLPVFGLDKKSIDIPYHIKKEADSEPPLCFDISDIGQIIVNELTEIGEVEEVIKEADKIGGCKNVFGKKPRIITWHDIND